MSDIFILVYNAADYILEYSHIASSPHSLEMKKSEKKNQYEILIISYADAYWSNCRKLKICMK